MVLILPNLVVRFAFALLNALVPARAQVAPAARAGAPVLSLASGTCSASQSVSITVKAAAVAPNYLLSPVSSKAYNYVAAPLAAPPYFSLAGGHYTTPQTLTLTDSTHGAVIYYTTNGSAPTPSSTKYTDPITVSTSELIEAIAVAPGYTNSNPSSKAYTIP